MLLSTYWKKMPWSRRGQGPTGKKLSRKCCCRECTPYIGTTCTCCTKSGGTRTMTRSIKSYSVKSSSWNSHVARFIVLLSLQVLTCMQFTTLNMDQEALGEPGVRPQVRAPRTCTHPAFVEPSGRVISLLNHWQLLQMREHNLRTTSRGKPQAYMRWIEPHAWSPFRKQGQPGTAPNRFQALHEENASKTMSEANREQEGHFAMDGDRKPGPQEENRFGVMHRGDNIKAVLILNKARSSYKSHSSTLRHREPAKAPSPKITCSGAPIPKVTKNHRQNTWHAPLWPGTWVTLEMDRIRKRLARTAISECNRTEQFDIANIAQHMRHDLHAESVNSIAEQLGLLLTAGLTREEPLSANQTKGLAWKCHQSLQSCPILNKDKSKRVVYSQLWTYFQDLSKLYQLPRLRLAMADAETAEQPQAERQEERSARPKRFPRSRVRADGTRRRTQTELDNRRQAKKDGTGFWATPAGRKVLAGQPQNGPDDDRSHGRPCHGPSQARSSSRTSRGSGQWHGEWHGEWQTNSGYHHGSSASWKSREDDTWWQSGWWNSSNWNEHQWTRASPAEPAEDKKESPQEEARRLMVEITQKNQEATSRKSSAGSTEMVPKARQDKRAAETATPGEPSKRHRPPPQPIATITKKWREWLRLQELLTSLREAGVQSCSPSTWPKAITTTSMAAFTSARAVKPSPARGIGYWHRRECSWCEESAEQPQTVPRTEPRSKRGCTRCRKCQILHPCWRNWQRQSRPYKV